MPITRLLEGSTFTPDQRHVLEQAFNNTLRKLNLVDRSDPICEIVARKIIEIARKGEHDPERMAALAVESIRK